MKVTGMLVVSLRGVHCRFLSHFRVFRIELQYSYSYRYRLGWTMNEN